MAAAERKEGGPDAAGSPAGEGLTPQERRLLESLPRGRRSAVELAELARRTGMGERHLRELIVHLTVDHGVGVGSSTDSWLGGYFLIQDEEDLRLAVRHLVPRAQDLARRVRALERLATARFPAQARLFEEAGAGGSPTPEARRGSRPGGSARRR